jgi:hypothetical protein
MKSEISLNSIQEEQFIVGLPKITRLLSEALGEQYQGDFYKLQFIAYMLGK